MFPYEIIDLTGGPVPFDPAAPLRYLVSHGTPPEDALSHRTDINVRTAGYRMSDHTLIAPGSLADDSRSAEIASYVHEQIEDSELFDPRQHELEFCDARDWDAYGEDTSHWQQLVADADRYIFVVPVYNWGMSGVFKNMIDLIPPETDVGDRAGVIGVGHDQKGFLMTQREVTSALEYFGIQRITPTVFLQHSDWADGTLDQAAQGRLDRLISRFRGQ